MTRGKPTNQSQGMHTVELDLPIYIADKLAAKAGSVDAAVVQALQDYMRTAPEHREYRDNTIRQLALKGKAIEWIAATYGMTTTAIHEIVG